MMFRKAAVSKAQLRWPVSWCPKLPLLVVVLVKGSSAKDKAANVER